MGKQTCSANKHVTFTVIVERVNSLHQLLNLLGSEALYEISIRLVPSFPDMMSYLANKNGEAGRAHQDRCSYTI